MTIALGILAGNSQILAADTEVSCGSQKNSESKISWRVHPRTSKNKWGIMAITGAGDSANIKAFQSDLHALFRKVTSESMDELEAAIAKTFKAFYKDYVNITPYVDYRPDVSLIIAARRGIASRTWTTERNRLLAVDGTYWAVGSGASYAYSLLERVALVQHPETAMILAAYVIFLVKRFTQFVGLETQVCCLNPDSLIAPTVFGTAQCRQLEELFRMCVGVEGKLLHRMFGSDYDFCESKKINEDMELIRKKFEGLTQAKKANPTIPTADQSHPQPSPE